VAAAMAVFKSFVSSVTDANPGKRRNSNRRVPTGDLENALKPQRVLVSAVREMVQECMQSFEALRKAQLTVMRAAQGYLGFDTAGLDESALALLQASSAFFQASESALTKSGLREVSCACDRILKEFAEVAGLIKDRDEAHREFEHYNEKVANILAGPQRSTGDRERLDRNQEKLTLAQKEAHGKRQACETAVRTIVERRTFHVRATLHAALRQYVSAFASLGEGAAPVAEAFIGELKVGTPVEVVGFPEGSEINGLNSVVASVLDHGQLQISIPGEEGPGKAVRSEHLIPVGAAGTGEDDAEGGEGADGADGAAAPGAGEPPLRVTPATGPTAGCEAHIVATGLRGTIAAVTVGGKAAEIVEASDDGLRVQVPPGIAEGPVSVEVWRDGWKDYVARVEHGFSYFEALTFGACGLNVELSAPPAMSSQATAVAFRREGLVQAVAVTSQPVPQRPGAGRRGRRYFEVGVLELSEQKTTKTMSLGFAWAPAGDGGSAGGSTSSGPPRSADGAALAAPTAQPSAAPAAAAAAGPAWGRLPENAAAMQRAFVVGGELPKAHLAGQEVGKVTKWRPLRDVVAGSSVGALLEETEDELSLTVFQDSVQRFSITAMRPKEWAAAAVHGVVDISGHVRRVELKQGVAVPEAPEAPSVPPSSIPASPASSKAVSVPAQ